MNYRGHFCSSHLIKKLIKLKLNCSRLELFFMLRMQCSVYVLLSIQTTYRTSCFPQNASAG